MLWQVVEKANEGRLFKNAQMQGARNEAYFFVRRSEA